MHWNWYTKQVLFVSNLHTRSHNDHSCRSSFLLGSLSIKGNSNSVALRGLVIYATKGHKNCDLSSFHQSSPSSLPNSFLASFSKFRIVLIQKSIFHLLSAIEFELQLDNNSSFESLINKRLHYVPELSSSLPPFHPIRITDCHSGYSASLCYVWCPSITVWVRSLSNYVPFPYK